MFLLKKIEVAIFISDSPPLDDSCWDIPSNGSNTDEILV